MSIIVVGLDRRITSPDLLGTVAVSGDRLAETLQLLGKSDHITESVVLSTCMRTEMYVDAVRFHGALADVAEVFARIGDVPQSAIADQLFVLHDEDAYAHLFRVAAGLESAVIGEGEVLGQVARSWDFAREAGAARTSMSSLFRHAVGVGKRVRRETLIARGTTSIGQAAAEMAADHLGSLQDRSVLVIGAGEMGESMAGTLSRVDGIGEITVMNRTAEKAEQLAANVGGKAIPMAHLQEVLTSVDVVLTSTGSQEPIVTVADIADRSTPLVIVDIAVPRDVEAAVGEQDGVTVLDLEDLRSFTATARADRAQEAIAAEQIVQEEVAIYCQDVHARVVTPLVVALREQMESIRSAEVERLRHKLGDQQEMVHAVTKSVLAKLLHEPTIRLKNAAGTPEGERMADALRMLFEI